MALHCFMPQLRDETLLMCTNFSVFISYSGSNGSSRQEQQQQFDNNSQMELVGHSIVRFLLSEPWDIISLWILKWISTVPFYWKLSIVHWFAFLLFADVDSISIYRSTIWWDSDIWSTGREKHGLPPTPICSI